MDINTPSSNPFQSPLAPHTDKQVPASADHPPEPDPVQEIEMTVRTISKDLDHTRFSTWKSLQEIGMKFLRLIGLIKFEDFTPEKATLIRGQLKEVSTQLDKIRASTPAHEEENNEMIQGMQNKIANAISLLDMMEHAHKTQDHKTYEFCRSFPEEGVKLHTLFKNESTVYVYPEVIHMAKLEKWPLKPDGVAELLKHYNGSAQYSWDNTTVKVHDDKFQALFELCCREELDAKGVKEVIDFYDKHIATNEEIPSSLMLLCYRSKVHKAMEAWNKIGLKKEFFDAVRALWFAKADRDLIEWLPDVGKKDTAKKDHLRANLEKLTSHAQMKHNYSRITSAINKLSKTPLSESEKMTPEHRTAAISCLKDLQMGMTPQAKETLAEPIKKLKEAVAQFDIMEREEETRKLYYEFDKELRKAYPSEENLLKMRSALSSPARQVLIDLSLEKREVSITNLWSIRHAYDNSIAEPMTALKIDRLNTARDNLKAFATAIAKYDEGLGNQITNLCEELENARISGDAASRTAIVDRFSEFIHTNRENGKWQSVENQIQAKIDVHLKQSQAVKEAAARDATAAYQEALNGLKGIDLTVMEPSKKILEDFCRLHTWPPSLLRDTVP